jgi:PIN domain nuclease of toxin-antitoxin system
MILLDTCALVWMTTQPGQLSAKAAEAVRRNADAIAVVPISAWEIAIKCRDGGLRLSGPYSPHEWYQEAVRRYGLHEIPLDALVLCESVALPPIHRDRCDRMIVAAALRHCLPIVTADTTIPRYPDVTVVW